MPAGAGLFSVCILNLSCFLQTVHYSLMAKTKDRSDELFDRLHDAEDVKRLNKQARRERREKRRQEWWKQNGRRD